MRPLDVFRTATFRLASAYLILFAVSATLILAFVYSRVADALVRETDATIDAEVQGLIEQYDRRGVMGLSVVILERASNPNRRTLYLLTYGGHLVAGNLQRWPADAQAMTNDRVSFSYVREADGDVRSVRAYQTALKGGFKLLVGRDMNDVNAIEGTLRLALIGAIALAASGLAADIWMSCGVLRRRRADNGGGAFRAAS